MSENIIWTVEGIIKDAQREAFDSIMNEMVEATSKEEGSLVYEWTLGADGKEVHVYERYRDVEAAKAHLLTWSQMAGRFMSVVDISRIVLFSPIPPELKAAFAGAKFMEPIGGFTKT